MRRSIAKGFETLEDAKARVAEMRECPDLKYGYGFYPEPIQQTEDGTFAFVWLSGSSCD